MGVTRTPLMRRPGFCSMRGKQPNRKGREIEIDRSAKKLATRMGLAVSRRPMGLQTALRTFAEGEDASDTLIQTSALRWPSHNLDPKCQP